MIEPIWLWIGDMNDAFRDWRIAFYARLRIAILGMLFWIVFSCGVLLTLACQFCGIFKFLLTGSESERVWVTKTGKGTDALNNAAWFGGDQRETISSHTGRWVASGKPLPPKFRFVRWLTDLFEEDHAVKAIEAPFRSEPL